MSRVVWKFPLGFGGGLASGFDVYMPAGATVLTAAMQYGSVVLWADVDPDEPLTSRRFGLVGTGNPVPWPSVTYVGTVFPDEHFVFHVFEVC